MVSRRRRRQGIGKIIVSVESRVRKIEKNPSPKRLKANVVTTEKLGFRAVTTKTVAADAITPNEAAFGTTVVSPTQPTEYLKEGFTWVNPDDGATNVYSATLNDFVPVTDANAQLTADGKNTIYAQTTAPSGASLKTNDIWYDTDDGNKLYVWSGTAWTNIQDTAITAAAQAATAATNTANGKNRIIRSTADASGTSDSGGIAYKNGDLWWKMASTDVASEVLAQYTFNGTAWVANTLANAVIANLDAAKITSGFISASRIQANTLDVNVLTAGTLRTGTIYTGQINANQITAGTVMASVSITSPTINGGTINGGSLNLSTSGSTDRIVMSSSQANTISFYSSSASFPNPGEISNGIESITLQDTLVETASLFMRPAATTYGIFASYPFIKMNQGTSGTSYMEIGATNMSIQLGTGVSPGTFQLYQFGNYSSDSSNNSVSIRNIYFNTAAPTVYDGVAGDVWLRG